MLATINRLTSREDFARTTRSGMKVSTDSLIGYLLKDSNLTNPKIGFIVSRNLGGAVKRHRIARQLRHAVRGSISILPHQSFVVVRAKKDPLAEIEIPQLFKSLKDKSEKKTVQA